MWIQFPVWMINIKINKKIKKNLNLSSSPGRVVGSLTLLLSLVNINIPFTHPIRAARKFTFWKDCSGDWAVLPIKHSLEQREWEPCWLLPQSTWGVTGPPARDAQRKSPPQWGPAIFPQHYSVLTEPHISPCRTRKRSEQTLECDISAGQWP